MTTEMTKRENGTHLEKAPTPSWASAAVDVLEGEAEYLVFADIPGVKKDDIHIQYAEGELRLEASRTLELEGSGSHYRRVFAVGPDVDVDKIDASVENGVLTVHLPKLDSVKPRQIEVKVG